MEFRSFKYESIDGLFLHTFLVLMNWWERFKMSVRVLDSRLVVMRTGVEVYIHEERRIDITSLIGVGVFVRRRDGWLFPVGAETAFGLTCYHTFS